MTYIRLIIVICAFIAFVNHVQSNDFRKRVSALKNKHLVATVTELPISAKIQRNATGHIVGMEGVSPLVMQWLSRRFKFQYTVLDVNASSIEERPNLPGLLGYLLRGECDVLMSAIYPAAYRTLQVNFVYPWVFTQTALLIPMPKFSYNNIDAVIKPFQFWVWIGLFVAVLAVVITLRCFSTCKKYENVAQKNQKNIFKGEIRTISVYVFGTLLNQGGYISSKATTIRLVIGGWCLLVLVLLNTYNGILISYVTATRNAQPLVNSVNDILARSNVKLVVDKGGAHDLLFSMAEKGVYKALGDRMRSYSNSRCNSTQQCVGMVKSLPQQHVYVTAVELLKTIIREEYLRTKKCQLTIVGGGAGFLSNRPLGWILAKKSPYLEEFNYGILMLHETGLLHFWGEQMQQTRPCYNDEGVNRQRTKLLVRLSLANLASAFTLLAVGYLISLFLFVIELITYRHLNQRVTIKSDV